LPFQCPPRGVGHAALDSDHAECLFDKGPDAVKFITNHHKSLHIFRQHSTVELLKPGETRFASQLIMLQRINDCRDALQETVVDREYKKWVSSLKNTTVAKSVSDTILDQCFWESVAEIISMELCHVWAKSTGKCTKLMPHYKVPRKNQLRTFLNNRWKMLHTVYMQPALYLTRNIVDPKSCLWFSCYD